MKIKLLKISGTILAILIVLKFTVQSSFVSGFGSFPKISSLEILLLASALSTLITLNTPYFRSTFKKSFRITVIFLSLTALFFICISETYSYFESRYQIKVFEKFLYHTKPKNLRILEVNFFHFQDGFIYIKFSADQNDFDEIKDNTTPIKDCLIPEIIFQEKGEKDKIVHRHLHDNAPYLESSGIQCYSKSVYSYAGYLVWDSITKEGFFEANLF